MPAYTIVTTTATQGSDAAEVNTLTDDFGDQSEAIGYSRRMAEEMIGLAHQLTLDFDYSNVGLYDGDLLDEPQLRRIGLPVVNKQHKTLTFHAWYPGCPMEEDAYGIPKPKDTELIVPTLRFVPCVGYGAGGYRLGYGGGFYDRTLAALEPRPFTVGLGYTNGYVDEFEPESHDQPLDAILNDNGVVWPVG